VNVCRVNVIEGEPNDRQMTTGNHTVRDIYCCKCKTILGWKYVSILFARPFPFPICSRAPRFVCRTRRMNNPKSTKKGSTSSSATSSSTCNSRDVRAFFGAPRGRTIGIILGKHIFDLLGIAFFLTCDGTLPRLIPINSIHPTSHLHLCIRMLILNSPSLPHPSHLSTIPPDYRAMSDRRFPHVSTPFVAH
jgi:hypothetical protein